MFWIKIVFALFILALWGMRLRIDFGRDRGLHRKAKALHVCCMMLLLPWALYAWDGFAWFRGALQGHLRGDPFTRGLGLVSAIACIASMFYLLQLGSRTERARRAAVWVFPLFGLVTAATSAYGFFKGPPTGLGAAALFALAAFPMILLYSLPTLFYRGASAKTLFALGPLTKEHVRAAMGRG